MEPDEPRDPMPSAPQAPPRVDEDFASEAAVSDARLVEAARRGDKDAFGSLVRRYERRLVRVLFRFASDFELSRDLAQETFLRVYERLDQFDPSRRFAPWLFQVGVNLTLDYLRRRKRRGRWSLFSDAPNERPPEPEVADPRRAIELGQEVHAVLDRVPEKYRAVLILRDLEGFTTSEIAAILGRKEATIRWRLVEARTRFQELWNKRQAASDQGPLGRIAPANDDLEGSETEND